MFRTSKIDFYRADREGSVMVGYVKRGIVNERSVLINAAITSPKPSVVETLIVARVVIVISSTVLNVFSISSVDSLDAPTLKLRILPVNESTTALKR